ncbi:LRR receptor-like serine/threonine-protein kinase FLS2 [Malania oleifera]|uniref:LRR receptor-like serine/threonine-protein kinase FLS2 n=1 Tax=Malania oleifera TaxID=397392 RepID=UPI0025AE1859|nr:LRR receptor-like serine/threonine-protein kinase FLS2 [Malania oleifera]
MASPINTSFLLLVCCILFTVLPAEPSFEVEVEALRAFKNSIAHDPFGELVDWTDTSHHCNWSGIACDPSSNHVTSISLVQKNLQGELSPFLGNITTLQVLDLTSNSFSGHIPPELGNLRNLQSLHLDNNFLYGSIPESICNCTHLLQLDLSFNNFTGIIPLDIGNLANLQFFAASRNNLEGPLPVSIGRLEALQAFDLSRNQVSGQIPHEVGNLSNLEFLQLSKNMLVGEIPSELVDCRKLVSLNLYCNFITGKIPSNIGLLHKLENITLYNNLLNGSIPSSITNCTTLVSVALSYNRIAGEIPRGLGNLQNLTFLSLGNNMLSGKLPDDIYNCSNLCTLRLAWNNIRGTLRPSIGKLHNLQALKFDGNSFAGTIPQEIGNLSQLIYLGLAQNNFSGLVPHELSKLSLIQLLFLQKNQLEGAIPEKIFAHTQLINLSLRNNKFTGAIPNAPIKLNFLLYLRLSGNMLTGSIPSSMAQLFSALMVLDLSNNHLTGSIPGSVMGSMKTVQLYLNLSFNLLTGTIPDELGMLQMVQAIDISNNNLSGTIPKTLEGCKNLFSLDLSGNELSGQVPDEVFSQVNMLESMNLSRNHFYGELPKNLANLKNLISLDLSQNKFNGVIPESLANLPSLKFLNLSYNQLEGPIPEIGVFKNIQPSWLAGNLALCNAKFLNPCNTEDHQNTSRIFLKKTAIVLIAVGSVSLLLVLMFTTARFHHYIKTHKIKEDEDPTARHRASVFTLKRFDQKDLEIATGSYSEEHIIGCSSLSTVYKGRLLDGQIVAIKKLNLHQFSAESEKCFNREVKTLSQLKHRSLIKVLGYAWESGKLKALVLEFMDNGNLESVIHEPQEDSSRWTLSERINVLVSVASGLDYLHSGYDFPIVHCDLKPSNILLDGDWEAHVSDFGAARMLGVGVHPSNGSLSSASAFAGSIGYLPPELAYMRKVSTKVDVFSFGVIVMEFVTKQRPTGLAQEDGLPVTLHQLVERTLASGRNQLLQVVDPCLASKASEKHVEIIAELLKLALSCTNPEPRDRPGMNEVLSSLLKLRAR